MDKSPDSIRAMQWFQILRQGGLILAAIAMANGLLSQQEIGNYELLLFTGFSLSFFWVDGLIKSYLIEYSGSDHKKEMAFNIYLLLISFSAIIVLIFIIGGNSIIPVVLGQTGLSYYVLYGVYLFFMLPTNILSVHLMLKNMVRMIYLSGLIMLLAPVVIVFISMAIHKDINLMYQGFVAYGCIFHLIMLGLLVPGWKAQFRPELMQTLISLAWPLMIYAVAMSMARIFDGWLVSWFYNDQETFAVFRYGAREFPLAVALATGLTTAFVPRLQNDLSSALHELKRRSAKLIHLIFPLSGVIMLFSPWIFRFVFTEAFVESAFIFNIYLLLILSQFLFPHAVVLSFKENKTILRASLLELVINIAFSFILIKYWELEGVAIATVLAYLVEKAIYVRYLKAKHQIDPASYIPLKVYGIYSLLVIVCFVVSRFYIWI